MPRDEQEDGGESTITAGPISGQYYDRSSGGKPVIKPPEGFDFGQSLRHDRVRMVTTVALLSTLAGTILLAFLVLLFRPTSWTDAKDLLQIVIPLETTLLGLILGYYFGQNNPLRS